MKVVAAALSLIVMAAAPARAERAEQVADPEKPELRQPPRFRPLELRLAPADTPRRWYGGQVSSPTPRR